MGARLRRAFRALAASGGVTLACTSGGDGPVRVMVGPTLLFPRDILTNATSVTLAVYNETTGVGCDSTSGRATGAASATPTVDSAALGPCPAGSSAKFCGTLTIAESAATLVFAAAALDSTGATIAYGCTPAVVSTPSVALSISMIQSAPAATCGDGIIEPGEQCDPPPPAGTTDAVCDSECHSQEETLSTGSNTPEGPPFLLWPAGSGQTGELFAFFTDANAGGDGNANVAMRVMTSALEPIATPTALATALLAPNDMSSSLPPLPATASQSRPSAAFVLGTYFYVFIDEAAGGGPTGIQMWSFDGALDGQGTQGSAIAISNATSSDAGASDGGVGTGDSGAARDGSTESVGAPSIAVSGTGSLFIGWPTTGGPTAGQIFGRTYTPTGGSLGLVGSVSTSGTMNENVQATGTATGWVVVWDDTTAIKMRVYSGNGTPNGPEILVSDATHTGTQDHPSIAALGDGRVAVVWADHGTEEGADIFVQRYDANFVATAGDQAAPINNLVGAGDQTTPAVAGTTAAGGSFIAAWIDAPSGQVRGRVLDGTQGFALNPVDGTTNEFQASVAPGPQRENPSVAVGGDGPWAAIGWDVGGVVSARRFPTSTEAAP